MSGFGMPKIPRPIAVTVVSLAVLLAAVWAGTALSERQRSAALRRELAQLAAERATPDQVLALLDAHLGKASQKDASAMVLQLEQAQRRYLPRLEAEYFAGDRQARFFAFHVRNLPHGSRPAPNPMAAVPDDPDLRELLARTARAGYKLETAEGTYFPVIDYEAYRRFRPRVAPDLAAYLDLMATETRAVAAKDAALLIGWDEVLRRALAQEDFLRRYPDSARAPEVRRLYQRYLTFALYGANNTPLFEYVTHTMAPEARTAYARVAAQRGEKPRDSRFRRFIGEFLALVERNGYRLTAEVERYRDEKSGNGAPH